MCRKFIQNRKEAFYKKWKLTVKRLITAFFDGCKEKGPGLKYSHGVLYQSYSSICFPKNPAAAHKSFSSASLG